MGISLLHTALELLLLGTFIRTMTYALLSANPESRLGKFLAYAY